MGNADAQEKKTMKGLITICSECQTPTELRDITITFERNGIRAAMSGIPAMVCPHCVQEYVPGKSASSCITYHSWRPADCAVTPF